MKTALFAVAVAAAAASAATAGSARPDQQPPQQQQHQRRQQEQPRVIEFGVSRRNLPGLRVGKAPLPLARRADGTFDQTTINNITGGGYYVEVEVGTPGQRMSMVLDTGSSDAWVVSDGADLCSSPRLQDYYGDSCGGTFDPNRSSTYKLVDRGGFSITYLDGGGAQGDYITDDFTIAGVTIRSLQMGLADSTDRGTGVLGVGFSANEAALDQYPNIIDEFAAQGLIQSKAYSLWLNDRRSPQGSILFGGLDTDKFIGPLRALPILQTSTGDYAVLAVAMTSLTARVGSSRRIPIPGSPAALPAILDSGTTLSYLPGALAEPIFDRFGAVTDDVQTGLTFVDCKYLAEQPDATLSFGFGSVDAQSDAASTAITIAVPVYELVLDVFSGAQGLLPNLPFDNACLFGIQSTDGLGSDGGSSRRRRRRHPLLRRADAGSSGGGGSSSGQQIALLGDTFLRSAYVVYDLEHKQIGLAPANLNSSITKIVELSADDSGLPQVTGVASQQTTFTPTPTATGSSSRSSSSASGDGGDGSSDGGSGQGRATVTVTATHNAAAGLAGPGPVRMDLIVVSALAGLFALVGSSLLLF